MSESEFITGETAEVVATNDGAEQNIVSPVPAKSKHDRRAKPGRHGLTDHQLEARLIDEQENRGRRKPSRQAVASIARAQFDALVENTWMKGTFTHKGSFKDKENRPYTLFFVRLGALSGALRENQVTAGEDLVPGQEIDVRIAGKKIEPDKSRPGVEKLKVSLSMLPVQSVEKREAAKSESAQRAARRAEWNQRQANEEKEFNELVIDQWLEGMVVGHRSFDADGAVPNLGPRRNTGRHTKVFVKIGKELTGALPKELLKWEGAADFSPSFVADMLPVNEKVRVRVVSKSIDEKGKRLVRLSMRPKPKSSQERQIKQVRSPTRALHAPKAGDKRETMIYKSFEHWGPAYLARNGIKRGMFAVAQAIETIEPSPASITVHMQPASVEELA